MDTITSGSSSGTNGAVAGAPAEAAAATAAGWVRLADLAADLGRSPRRLRELVRDKVPPAHQERRRRPGGGSAELWVSPSAARQLRAFYAAAGTSGDSSGGAGAPAATAAEAAAEAAGGWHELVAELRADRDRLRSELATVTAARDVALQRADLAETGLRSAERRVDSLRAAWGFWWGLLQGMTAWQRLRRRWPPLPAELGADRLLTAGGEQTV